MRKHPRQPQILTSENYKHHHNYWVKREPPWFFPGSMRHTLTLRDLGAGPISLGGHNSKAKKQEDFTMLETGDVTKVYDRTSLIDMYDFFGSAKPHIAGLRLI